MKPIYFAPAIVWFIVSLFLLTLPGNDLPNSGFFALPYLDKIVHVVMFFLLTALFCFPFLKVTDQPLPIFATIAGGVILYGVIMEFIQKHFASARSFDLVDIVFDTIGSLAGLVAMQLFIQKNRPR